MRRSWRCREFHTVQRSGKMAMSAMTLTAGVTNATASRRS
jgi:hypothetical protein